MSGFLTTHCLDTARGLPASCVGLTLLAAGTGAILSEATTNEDGRSDAPLLSGGAFRAGRYELIFALGAYFAQHYQDLPDPAFLDDVKLCFGIADSNAHYHVPLLFSPYGFSTYRGS